MEWMGIHYVKRLWSNGGSGKGGGGKGGREELWKWIKVFSQYSIARRFFCFFSLFSGKSKPTRVSISSEVRRYDRRIFAAGAQLLRVISR